MQYKAYRVVPQTNSTFGVQVADGGGIITYFISEAEALAWMRKQREAEVRALAQRLSDAAKAI